MAGGAIFKLGSFGNFRDLRFTNEESRKAGRQCPGFKNETFPLRNLDVLRVSHKKRGLIYLDLP
jgi:hypothetical protein